MAKGGHIFGLLRRLLNLREKQRRSQLTSREYDHDEARGYSVRPAVVEGVTSTPLANTN